MINLTMDENHIYTDESGKVWDSVTQIIDRAGMSNQFNKDPYAAQRGVYAHKAVWLLDKGELDTKTLDDTIRPYVESYEKFRASRPEIDLHSEMMVHSELFGFCGTLDKVVRNGDYCDLWDLKTGPYDPTHDVQTAAYQLAWEELMGLKIRHRYGIHLQKNGSPAKMICHSGRSDRAVFLAALSVLNWRKNNGRD